MFGIAKETPVRDGVGLAMAILTALLLWTAVQAATEVESATTAEAATVELVPATMVEVPVAPAPANPDFETGRI